MKKFLTAALVAASVLAVAIPASVGAHANHHRTCFAKPGKYPPHTQIPIVCVNGPLAAAAYTGHAGCDIGSGLPSRWTVICAWHSNIRRIVVWADVRHWGAVSGTIGACAPGPCTSDSGYRSSEWSGSPTVGNSSDYTMHNISAYDYT